MTREWFRGVIIGQDQIDLMVREALQNKIGWAISTGDTMVRREEGGASVWTMRFRVLDAASGS